MLVRGAMFRLGPVVATVCALMVVDAFASPLAQNAEKNVNGGRGPTFNFAERGVVAWDENEYTTPAPQRVLREGTTTVVSCYDTTPTPATTMGPSTATPTTTEEGDTTSTLPEPTTQKCVTTVETTKTLPTTITTTTTTLAEVGDRTCYEVTTVTVTTEVITTTGTPTTTEEGDTSTSTTETSTTTTTCTTTTTATTSTTTTSTATTSTSTYSTTTTTGTSTTTITTSTSTTETTTTTTTVSSTTTTTTTGTTTATSSATTTATATARSTVTTTAASTQTVTVESSATTTESTTPASTLTSTATTTGTTFYEGVATKNACDDGFVGVVQIGRERSRAHVVCRQAKPFDQKLGYKATASWGSGFGAVPAVLSMGSDNVTYASSILAATHLANAQVTVALGTFSKTSGTITSATNAAALITGLLRTASVRHDDAACFPSSGGCAGPSVGASFQLREDVTFSVKVPSTRITVSVVPVSNTGVQPISKTFMCTFDGTSICHTNVPLTSAFTNSLPVGPQSMTVKYNIENKGTFTLPGTVTWYPAPASIASTASVDANTVYTVVPSRDLFPGDTFSIQVRSLFRSYLKTALVRVTLGSGLTITGDAVPDSSFKQTSVDRNSQQASAVLAGRKDGKSSGVQGAATDELLLTLTIRVNGNVQAGASTTIEITRLADLTDLNENGLNPSKTGMVETRDGIKTNEAGRVYFQMDRDVGIFSYVLAGNPTELLNTASISGTKIEVPIVTKGISIRGAESIKQDATCSSPATNTLGVSQCKATLSGTETVGSRKIEVAVFSVSGTTTVPFRVHQLVPNSVALSFSTSKLRPYAGLWDELDAECKTLQYQTSDVAVTAAFADGSGDSFDDYDVSSIAKLVSSAPNVAKVSTDDSMQIIGVSAGNVAIKVQGKTGVLATSTVTVADATPANMLGMVGIDVVLLDGIDNVARAGAGTYVRNSEVGISIGAVSAKQLQYEGDSLTLLASAVFEDDSRLELTASNGLVVESYAEASITVKNNQLVVPLDPKPANGSLIGVSWQPQGDCQESNDAMSTYMSRNVTIAVTPVMAESMTASSSKSFIVVSGDGATAAGANYPTQAQLSVSLVFETKTKNNLQADSRTAYANLTPDLFTVDVGGKVTANNDGRVGTGSVNITFEGQAVFKVVDIVVAKLSAVSLRAVPYPPFSNSAAEDVTRISKIACTEKYQQAQFTAKITISNGAAFSQQKDIGGQNFDIERTGSEIQVSAGSLRVVTASAAGSRTFIAKFGTNGAKLESNAVVIESSNTPVTVTSIDNVRLMSGTSRLTTLKGYKNGKTAQVQLGVTLSDNRKYTAALSSSGSPALPGLLAFSSDAEFSIAMDASSGKTTLIDNYHEAVVLSVETCATVPPQVKATLSMFANLDPMTTDVDVGSATSAPVPEQSKGSQFTVPVRVNTNGKTLKAFNVLVAYNADDLEFVEVQHTVAANQGSVEFKPGRSAGNADLENVCALAGLGNTCAVAVATISNSKVRGSAAAIFEATFKVKSSPSVASLTYISGVTAQLLDTSQGGGETIGTKNTVFVSGNIPVSIADGNRRQRRHSLHRPVRFAQRLRRDETEENPGSGSGSGDDTTNTATTVTVTTVTSSTTSTTPYVDLRLRKGDANCDDDFDLKDAAFILDYVAARGNDFKTSLGSLMKSKVAACQSKLGLTSNDLAFMDPDSNTEITLLDLTYMLDILAGNFAFMAVDAPIETDCQTVFSVEMTTAQGGIVPQGTRLFLDFAMDVATNYKLLDALVMSGAVVSNSKGTDALSGVLVELDPDAEKSSRYYLELGLALPLIDIGVSAIQVSSNSAASPQWKFFGGKPTNGFATSKYKGVLEYPQSVIGASSDLTLTNGYNALFDKDQPVAGYCTSTTRSTTTTTVTTTTVTTTSVSSTTATTTTSSMTTTTTSVSTTTTTPTPVVIIVYFMMDCNGETDLAAIVRFFVTAIEAAVGPGLLRNDIPPGGVCGSIVLSVTAVSADAADAINGAIAAGLSFVNTDTGELFEAVSDTTTSTTSTVLPGESRNATALTIGSVVGVALGSVFFIGLVSILVWYFKKRVKENHDMHVLEKRNYVIESNPEVWSDFDDNIEVGKFTKNPLHETAFRGRKKSLVMTANGKWKEDPNQTEKNALEAAANAAAPAAPETVAMDDVWGINDQREDGVTAVIHKQSLDDIWGIDDDAGEAEDINRAAASVTAGLLGVAGVGMGEGLQTQNGGDDEYLAIDTDDNIENGLFQF